jgi:hypothetical protein
VAPRHGFEPRFLTGFQFAELIDFAKSLKWSKASKASTLYKIGTKPGAPDVHFELDSNDWDSETFLLSR